jgi:hypothetical protein
MSTLRIQLCWIHVSKDFIGLCLQQYENKFFSCSNESSTILLRVGVEIVRKVYSLLFRYGKI